MLIWDYGHLTLTGSQWVNDHVLREPLLDALGIKKKPALASEPAFEINEVVVRAGRTSEPVAVA